MLYDLGAAQPPDGIDRLDRARSAWNGAHAKAGIAAAAAVLDEEQATWIRDRHRPWAERRQAGEIAGTPTGGCIIAAADMWDALVAIDASGNSRDHQDAAGELSRHAGAWLCPMVADVLPAAAADGAEAPAKLTG